MIVAEFSEPIFSPFWDKIEEMGKESFIFKLTSRLLSPLLLIFSFKSWASDIEVKPYTGSVGATTNQLAPSVGDVPGNRYNFDLKFDYHKNDPHLLERKFTFNALLNDQNLSMFSLNEASVTFRRDKHRLTVGRQILDWSLVDAFWGFGKLNNRQNFNYFEPGLEGLIGFNLKLNYSNGFSYQLFGSFLYAPETNPSSNINNSEGTITSSHPWSKPPSPTATISTNGPTRDVRIDYNVNYPTLSDVVFRYTIGLKFGIEKKNFSADAFVLRKPENQISTTVNVSYDAGLDIVNADITPQFYYHDLYGGSLRYQNNGLKLYLSGIAIRPNEFPDGNQEAFEYTQIETEKRREDYVGGGISFEKDHHQYGFNYVARLSPFNREDDILAVDPRWNQAVNGFFKWQMTPSFNLRTDLKYDMLTTDRLVMIQANYAFNSRFLINGGINMIGTPNNGKSFWSPYKNNDSLYTGIRVIF